MTPKVIVYVRIIKMYTAHKNPSNIVNTCEEYHHEPFFLPIGVGAMIADACIDGSYCGTMQMHYSVSSSKISEYNPSRNLGHLTKNDPHIQFCLWTQESLSPGGCGPSLSELLESAGAKAAASQ